MSDVLNEFLQVGEDDEAEREDNQSYKTIAQVSFTWAYQGFAGTDTQEFPFPYNNKAEKIRQKQSCEEFLEMIGGKGFPKIGVLIIVRGNDVPTSPEGSFPNGDWSNFIERAWSNSDQQDLNWLSKDTGLSLEELDKYIMPWNMVINNLALFPVLMEGKTHWCKLTQELDSRAKIRGKTTKKGKSLRIWTVQEVYSSEAEAKAAAAEINAAKSNGPGEMKPDMDSGLSAKAVESGLTMEKLMAETEAIHNQVLGYMNGRNHLGKKIPILTQTEAFIQVALDNAIQVSDIQLLDLKFEEPPF